jgi:hypothetical protein
MKKENKFYHNEWRSSKTKKTYRKPKKFLVYIPEIQERIYKESKKVILRKIKEYNKGRKTGRIVKATIFGSFLHKEMGMYWAKYMDIRYGSDVDVFCVTEQGFKKPNGWKLTSAKSHSTEYQVDTVENYIEEIEKKTGAPTHPINLLIFTPGEHSYKFAKERLPIDEKSSRKRGFKVETVFLDRKGYGKIKKELK